jgi:PAS domain S-box-containing protein
MTDPRYESIMNNRYLDKYTRGFTPDEMVFKEGEYSSDLYILREGRVAVFKDSEKITEISEPGEIFGEMTAVMGGKRTATIKALEQTTVLCVPKSDLSQLFLQVPDLFKDISWLLAERLAETSQALVGFQEICDQLPDAVLITDRNNRIIASNSAALRLYGHDRDSLHQMGLKDLFDDPERCQNCLGKVQQGFSLQEQYLKLRPGQDESERYASVSMTGLYDEQHEYQGVMTLARDQTQQRNIQKKLKRLRYYLFPSLLILALLTGAVLFGFPYFMKGYQTTAIEKSELRNQLAKDYVVLSSLVQNNFHDPNELQKILKRFITIQEPAALPYLGIVMLDEQKKVITAYSLKQGKKAANRAGTTYAHIRLPSQGDESIHRVLVLYRKTKGNPGGEKCIEIAFKLISQKTGNHRGWMVFQMNKQKLNDLYSQTVEDMKLYQFKPGRS